MTREGSFLNGSTRGLNYLRAKNMDSHLLVTPAIFKPGSRSIEKPKKKKKFGFPIKDFGNDRKRGRHP